MIFATVGAQMPFDRMMRALDEWACRRGRPDVLAQIGPTDWRPRHIAWVHSLEPQAFRRQVERAGLIVAHAGMGTILTALELGKPILVMPRRGDLRETRNDHQVATARQLLAQGRVHVAFDEQELMARLDSADVLAAGTRIAPYASPQLLAAVRDFIFAAGAERRSGKPGARDASGPGAAAAPH